MRRSFLTTLATIVLISAAGTSQTPPPMPKPGPEHKKLEYYAGNWKMDGDVKPGPMGPGGKFSGTQKGEMMNGGFFLVMHSDMTLPGFGSGKGLAVMGYNPEEKKYTYNAFNTWGENEAATGTVDGNTWTWTDEHKMGGQITHGRYTAKVTSPTTYDFKYEVSAGGDYATVMEGKATKQ
jgi:Protein of unknown function (DUF1579)